MKYIFGLVIIAIVASIGLGLYFKIIPTIFVSQTMNTVPVQKSTESLTTLTGTLQKVSKVTDDYTHLIITDTGIKGLNSYTVPLDEYIGKKVEVTGDYSGTTLYVDNIQISQ